LVEVILALAVFSFAMIGMAGLIPQGLSAYRQAGTSTAEAQIIQNVTTQIELTGIANITVPSTTNFYFSDEGLQTNQAGALYTAKVAFSSVGTSATPPPSSPLLGGLTAAALDKVTIAISSKALSQTNTFSTFIAY